MVIKVKLFHILGSAGGGRDKSRREVMGRLAGKKPISLLSLMRIPMMKIL